MPDILEEKNRIARKEHKCSYCNETIEKGTKYEFAKLIYEGRLYEWKNHIGCGMIASKLWNFIDPDDGMTEDDFHEGCREFCNIFICPGCDKYNKESDECIEDKTYCIDKITEILKTHDFKRVKKDGDWMVKWVLELKENKSCQDMK